MIQTIIIDDEPNNIEALKQLLIKYCPLVELIGVAENIRTGQALIVDTQPDLVFLDIEMPFGNAFELLNSLTTGPGTAIALTFSTTDGQRSTTNNPATGSSFNPHNSQSVSVLFNGTVYVWLGASVSPPINQKAGTYSATVVLTTTGML